MKVKEQKKIKNTNKKHKPRFILKIQLNKTSKQSYQIRDKEGHE